MDKQDPYSSFWKDDNMVLKVHHPTASKRTEPGRPVSRFYPLPKAAKRSKDTKATDEKPPPIPFLSHHSTHYKFCSSCRQKLSESLFQRSQREVTKGWCKHCCKLNMSEPPKQFESYDHHFDSYRDKDLGFGLDEDLDENPDDQQPMMEE